MTGLANQAGLRIGVLAKFPLVTPLASVRTATEEVSPFGTRA